MRILLFHIILFTAFTALGQVNHEKKTVEIDSEESFVEIHGTTNVSRFNCSYTANLPEDPFEVVVIKDGAEIQFQHQALRLNVSNFTCPHSQMTTDLHELLDFENHPYIIFQLRKITNNQTAHVMIEMAGKRQSFTMDIENSNFSNPLEYHSKLKLCITDFGLIAPEKFLGMVKVNEAIEVEFKIKMNIIDN